MSQFSFDASRVEPNKPLEPVPTDWYLAKLVDSEITTTKDKQGEYFNGEIQLMAGPFAGRKVFARHNTRNANPQAVEIGMKELSGLCHAVGVMQISDTAQLHERPFEVRVILVPPEGVYDAKNEVKGYRAVGSGRTPAGNGAGGAPQQPSPVSAQPPFSAAPSFQAPPPPPSAPSFAPPAPPAPTAPPPSFGPPTFAGAAPQPPSYPPAAPAPQAAPPPPPAPVPPPPPPPPSKQLSPDGKYEWTGAQWVPVQAAPPPAAAPTVPVPSAPPQGQIPSWAQR